MNGRNDKRSAFFQKDANLRGSYQLSASQLTHLTIDVITSGEDITKHYLSETNKKFKIYRYNKSVYAVRFDEEMSKPTDFVHMWISHKGEQKAESKEAYQELDRGGFGIVYKKTEDKALKEVQSPTIHPEEVNIKILEQIFLLKEHDIEKYFVLGLWSIKNKNFYYMPKINTKIPRDYRGPFFPMFDEFILALKKLNELGYMHPDLSTHHNDVSFKNMLRAPEGAKLIDLDAGFFRYPKANSENSWGLNRHFAGMDQWIHVYNWGNFLGTWRIELSEWYNNNQGKALSTNPEVLLSFHEKGLSLPQSVIEELKSVRDLKKPIAPRFPSSNAAIAAALSIDVSATRPQDPALAEQKKSCSDNGAPTMSEAVIKVVSPASTVKPDNNYHEVIRKSNSSFVI